MRIGLRIAGVIGFLLFAVAFAMTLLSPIRVEQAAREFLRAEVEARVREQLGDLAQPGLERAAGLLAGFKGDEVADLRRRLETAVSGQVAAAVARMQDPDCACRRQLAHGVRVSFEWRIASLERTQAQLLALAQGKYADVVKDLLRDLRIFSGSNALVFALLIVISFVRQRAAAQLLLPATLLLVATLVSTWFYLFQQNWFLTLLYDDYVGFGYIIYLVGVFGLLCDIALNRARVTTAVINKLLEAIGSAASLSPC